MEIITNDAELENAGFYWRTKQNVRALICRALDEDKFTNGFSTRLGGCSPISQDALNLAGFSDDAPANIHENRRRFLTLFSGDWTLATCWQMHGADVHVITDKRRAQVSDEVRCDALTTQAPNILLGVKTADCVPVILGDARTKAIAAVHAGWRSTLASIISHTLERMREEFGTRAKDVRAAIGPAARACCYEVGDEVISAFRARFTDAESLLTPTPNGHALIDLPKANCAQLLKAGVLSERIHIAPLCTMCRTDLFFSYRREKKVYGRTGRLLSVIGRAQEI
jgi:YfiH family protein